MGLDKTLTVKQRRIDVYLPTMEAKHRWNQEAAKRQQSISQLVFEVMELELNKQPDDQVNRTAHLEQELSKALQDNEQLRRRNDELEVLHKRAEEDLQEYRAMEFLGGDPIKRLDSRLIKFLSEARTRIGAYRAVDHQELVRALRIKKGSESELKALAAQLEMLELHEVVGKTSKGWIWNG